MKKHMLLLLVACSSVTMVSATTTTTDMIEYAKPLALQAGEAMRTTMSPKQNAFMKKMAVQSMADMKGPARETLVQKSLLSDLAIAA